MTEPPAILVRGASKRFGKRVALCQLDLEIRRGEVLGLLGPNGAGKSTALRLVAGYLDPDEGRVDVLGEPVATERTAVQRHIGYLPENAALYPDMTVDEYLQYRARLKGVPRVDRGTRVNRAVQSTDLEDRRQSMIGQLSAGLRQRAALADAVLTDPPILLLDEPTTGLDPGQRDDFRDLLIGLAPDRAIIVSSHVLAEIEGAATRVAVLLEGRMRADGTLAELRRELSLSDTAPLGDIYRELTETS